MFEGDSGVCLIELVIQAFNMGNNWEKVQKDRKVKFVFSVLEDAKNYAVRPSWD